jgi:hypothetical protein
LVKICPYVSRGAFEVFEAIASDFSLYGIFQRIAIIIGNISAFQFSITKPKMPAPNKTKRVTHIGDVRSKNIKAANLVID